jgi:cytochrome oxidase Cu insertion factor (SCO1/SenC/PrrC family)
VRAAFLLTVAIVSAAGCRAAEAKDALPVVGKPAPDFAVSDHTGKTVRLADLRGKKVLIWFYPRAMTGG